MAAGVQPEDRVALCLERGAELVVALLAILKAGAAYVPLDPSYPAERLAFMLRDSAPVALISQRSMAAAFAAAGLPQIVLDDAADAAAIVKRPDTNLLKQRAGWPT
ncbi:AMP-binding protein [Massilia sp. B-10]|nr:AMP-binding protein [Massilia sp. B-10]